VLDSSDVCVCGCAWSGNWVLLEGVDATITKTDGGGPAQDQQELPPGHHQGGGVWGACYPGDWRNVPRLPHEGIGALIGVANTSGISCLVLSLHNWFVSPGAYNTNLYLSPTQGVESRSLQHKPLSKSYSGCCSLLCSCCLLFKQLDIKS